MEDRQYLTQFQPYHLLKLRDYTGYVRVICPELPYLHGDEESLPRYMGMHYCACVDHIINDPTELQRIVNAVVSADGCVIAIRKIEPGEEIVIRLTQHDTSQYSFKQIVDAIEFEEQQKDNHDSDEDPEFGHKASELHDLLLRGSKRKISDS